MLADLPPPPAGKTGWPWTVASPHAGTAAAEAGWPAIALVMPVRNGAMFLEAAIRSVLLQGYPRLEYVVMDGGSSDGSVDILRRYAHWLTHWESAPDGGPYAAVNAGFRHTAGAVMGWLNGDDMLAPDGLRQVGALFAGVSPAVEWIAGAASCWDAQDACTGVAPVRRYNRYCLRRGCYEGRGLGWIQQESVFWRRTLWDRAGGRLADELHLAADFELWVRFARRAELYAVRAVLGGIRRHPAQRSNDRAAYLAEVDRCLAQTPDGGRLARALRRPGLRRVLRATARRLGLTPAIGRDATGRWAVEGTRA